MSTQQRLKCQFCGYSCPAFIGRKHGRPSTGYVRLNQHVRGEHPYEFDAIRDALDLADPDRPLLPDPVPASAAGWLPSDPDYRADEAWA